MENRAIINEIYRTIMKAGIIPLSWGINTFKATWYRGMPTLKFHVNGFMHKGDVAVCLIEEQIYMIFFFLERMIMLLSWRESDVRSW